MREALVRATGRREAADDPVFAGLIKDAPKYVQNLDRDPRGETQVLFNGPALDKRSPRLTATSGIRIGRSPWWSSIRCRPRTARLPMQAGHEQAAEERGLPISIVPLPVSAESGNPLSRERCSDGANRSGAEPHLVGLAAAVAPPPPGPHCRHAGCEPRCSPSLTPPAGAQWALAPSAPEVEPAQAGPPPAWQWRLYTDFSTQSWSGPLTAVIDDTFSCSRHPWSCRGRRARPDRVR